MKTKAYGEVCQDGAYNIYYLSAASPPRNLDHTDETVSTGLIVQSVFEFVVIGLWFGLLFAGLWIGCSFDDQCASSYGVL